MPTQTADLRRVKEFANDAGVTVRTLHLYDKLGLLKPAATSESGYRLYGTAELERLEHILALRFIGLNLDQIKELLHGPKPPLVAALRIQRYVIEQRKRHLESALSAIEQAERALRDDSADLWQTLRTVMEAFKMQNDWDWVNRYYSEDALRELEARREAMPASAIEEGQRNWTTLLVEVERAVADGVDPSSERAAALAKRWRDLLGQFTGGSREIQSGLNRLWSDETRWPSDFKRPWSDEADAFIKEATNCGER